VSPRNRQSLRLPAGRQVGLELKTVIYKSKFLDFQHFVRLDLNDFCYPLLKFGIFNVKTK